ncbi:ribosomal 50S subunit-recycling heat shock protein [Scopulibacillus darangshiensis]|uniref:RQC P-site tRNA stabilizing factor n=1 Tax=Scopulibacillus darangshiensis TaxID=442528 RepID=A0A4R2NLT6_9BACL|nr:RNA-binding S4 domain-containing protein [Scopulibacillus darangshiensis]TCP22537.1 ribosomal 50S subunit-recycling heat shock protein [Scopulibacillus darangshiensis]
MRLDKFLKVSRLIKRRTLAKELADQGRVQVNGQAAKASSTVKVGDTLSIRYGQKVVTVKISGLQETVKKEDAQSLYEMLSEEPVNK